MLSNEYDTFIYNVHAVVYLLIERKSFKRSISTELAVK